MLKSGLPIATITDSGGKSIHALVRVDAKSREEYKMKVAKLHAYLEDKFGSAPDAANKNPSRLSRLAGVKRGTGTQRLLYTDVNIDAVFDDVVNKPVKAKAREKLTHDVIGDILIEEHGACMVDGMPVIESASGYQVGQDSVYRAILDIDRGATAHLRKEVMEFLKLVAPQKTQANPRYIRFKNGTLDIESMELLPNTSDRIILNEIPHNWNPDAKSQLVDETFDRIAQGDEAIISNFWEMFGLCMYRGHEVSRMMLLQGNGANGKSTLLGMLKCMIGTDNCFSLSVQELGEKFQLVPAIGKLALIGDDIASDYVGAKACAVLKKFVTGETVNDQYKGGATFQFDPYATLVYSCNDIPRFDDANFGLERRIHPIPLSARFTPNDREYDPLLKQKLCEEPCVEYAIVKAVEALKGCLNRMTLTPNRHSIELTSEIIQDSDSVAAFISDMQGQGYTIAGKVNSDVYKKYSDWCRHKGVEPLQLSSFSKRLCRRMNLQSRSSNGVRRFQPIEAAR